MYLQRQSLQPEFSAEYAVGTEPEWKLDNKTAKYYIVTKHGAEIREKLFNSAAFYIPHLIF